MLVYFCSISTTYQLIWDLPINRDCTQLLFRFVISQDLFDPGFSVNLIRISIPCLVTTKLKIWPIFSAFLALNVAEENHRKVFEDVIFWPKVATGGKNRSKLVNGQFFEDDDDSPKCRRTFLTLKNDVVIVAERPLTSSCRPNFGWHVSSGKRPFDDWPSF